jgi:hypothetical protein
MSEKKQHDEVFVLDTTNSPETVSPLVESVEATAQIPVNDEPDEVIITADEYAALLDGAEAWRALTIALYGALHVSYKAMAVAQSAKGKRERVNALSPAMGQAVNVLLDAAPLIAAKS